MEALVITYIITGLIALIFMVAFIWNVKNKQYDDSYSPPHRILFDDTKNKKNLND